MGNLTSDLSRLQTSLKNVHSQKSLFHSKQVEQLQKEKEKMNMELDVLKREVKENKMRDGSLAILETKIKGLKQQDQKKQEEISNALSSLREKDDRIISLQKSIDELYQEQQYLKLGHCNDMD